MPRGQHTRKPAAADGTQEIVLAYKPHPRQNTFHAVDADVVLFGGSAGPGKILPKNGVVVTPFGYKYGRDLRIGDAINAPDGSVARVIQIHPDVSLEAWTVHFHDGTKTVVAADHLWLSWKSGKSKKISNDRINGESSAQVIETRELRAWLDTALRQKELGQRPNWPCIPVCAPQPFNVQLKCGLRIEPYLLGAILGDGYISGAEISIMSADHAHTIAFLDGHDYGVSRSKGEASAYRFRRKSFQDTRGALIGLGLWGKHSWDKFIPREYKLGSIDTRWAIVQGLMDTDGYVDSDGDLFYTTTSELLADDMAFVIQSLGGIATKTDRIPTFTRAGVGAKGRRAYTLYIKHRDPGKFFRLERKRDRASKFGPPPMYRRVVKIEVGGVVHGNCITVSHPSGLYMTNDFIVTHNSTALLMDALIFVIENPGSTACLMRRTFPELEASLIKKSIEMFPPEFCRYNDAKHRWVIDTGAARSYVVFAHAERETDVLKHRSAEWQYLGIDESTGFTEYMFEQLLVRVRGSTNGAKPRVRLCSNPGLIGHGWHKKYFGITSPDEKGGHKPFETWRPPRKAGDKYDPPSRCFIPATIFDNPALLAGDPGYLSKLEALPEGQKRMLLYGEWTGFAGQYFSEFERSKHMVQPFSVPRHWKRYRSVDFGFAKPFSCHWHAIDERGHCFTYREAYQVGLRDGEQAKLIKKMSVLEGEEQETFEFTVGDPRQDVKSKDTGITTQENYHKEGILIFPGSNARVPGWGAMRNWLAVDPTTGTPWWTISNACPELIREIEEAVYDPNKPEDLDTRGSDHALDDCRYFFMARPAPAGEKPKLDPRARLDGGSRDEWASVEKLQKGIADTGNKSILHGFNE